MGEYYRIIKIFKSIIDMDTAPVVICDLEHTVVYMNPAAISRYHTDLTGKSLKAYHDCSFSSYVRFDFFRRILCDYVGDLVEKGEYDPAAAQALVENICYYNDYRMSKH